MHQSSLVGRYVLLGAVYIVAAGVAVPTVSVEAQQGREGVTTVEALAAKVKRFEDTQQIADLLNEYGRALDTRDFKAYAGLFAKDGSWSGGLGTVSGGPQAIYDFMTSRIGGGGRGGRPTIGFGSTYHIMSNFKIDVNGDTATATSRWTFVSAARGPGIQVAGRYEDRLVREDGVWKFKSRQAFNDVTAPAPASTAGPSSNSR
jgi:uncharacterized protein (TIGR02246 family)